MALLKCPECGEYVSEFADSCPHCGCPMSDIAQENQVDDRKWKKHQTKFKTNTQIYSQEELEEALKEARSGKQKKRKPGQERIVKNSESVLAPKNKKPKKKTKKKGKSKKSHKFLILIIAILVILAAGIIYYFAATAPSKDKDKDQLMDPSENTTEQSYWYNETNGTDTTQGQTQEETKITEKPTKPPKETTKKPTTVKPTTQPATHPPETMPEEPAGE